MNNIEYLQEFVTDTIHNLEDIKANGTREWSFTIDCHELEDYHNRDIRYAAQYEPIFSKLDKINGPILWWFEIIAGAATQEIVTTLLDYKKNRESRSTPALKKHLNFNSNVLYAETVTDSFSERLIQHLGFYGSSQIQGLQLVYWAMDLSLRVNILEFKENMADTMPIIEYAFAKRLLPLTGKQK